MFEASQRACSSERGLNRVKMAPQKNMSSVTYAFVCLYGNIVYCHLCLKTRLKKPTNPLFVPPAPPKFDWDEDACHLSPFGVCALVPCQVGYCHGKGVDPI